MKNTHRGIAALGCAAAVVLGAAVLGAQAPSGPGMHRVAVTPVSIGIGASTAQDAQEFDAGQDFRFYRPIVRVGQDYTLRAGEVAGAVRSVFGDVTLEGHVERDIVVVLGSVHATSTAVVDGSLVVIGGSATIDRGAIVHRDLVVVGGLLTAPPDFSPGGDHVVIGSPALGNALGAVVPWLTRGLLWGRLIVPDLGWVWVVVGIAFLVYLLVNTLFDGAVRTAADVTLERPVSVFFVGLLVLVLTIPAIVILAATVIGLAVVPFVLCAMFFAGLVGKAGVARALGRALVRQSSPDSKVQALRSFVLGSLVIGLAYMVPVLGFLMWALTSVLAVGAAAAMVRAKLRREHPPRERAVAFAAVAPSSGSADAAPAVAPLSAPPLADVPPAAVPGDLALFPRAAFLDRVAAFALDALLVGIAVALLNTNTHHDGWLPLVLVAYHVAFWAWKGTTLGGIVVGLRVIRTDGANPRFVDALVRGLSGIFSVGAFGIGCFWMLQDPERQMWHDKIAGTFVVKVPRALVLP